MNARRDRQRSCGTYVVLIIATASLACPLLHHVAGTRAQESPPDAGPVRAAKASEQASGTDPEFVAGTATMLRDIAPSDIEKMEITVLRSASDGKKREGATFMVDKSTSKILHDLLGKADKYEKPEMGESSPADAALKVTRTGGPDFSFEYSSDLDAPLGDWTSRPLKEALWALSHSSRISVIRLKGEEVQEVIPVHNVPSIRRGSTGSLDPPYEARLSLDASGAILCTLRIGRPEQPQLKVAKPIRYGGAFGAMANNKEEIFIVLLQLP